MALQGAPCHSTLCLLQAHRDCRKLDFQLKQARNGREIDCSVGRQSAINSILPSPQNRRAANAIAQGQDSFAFSAAAITLTNYATSSANKRRLNERIGNHE